MTDYSKLKVTELKDELKARGIPLTGLKLKQQFIEKLQELDSSADDGPKVEEEEKVDEAVAKADEKVEEVSVEAQSTDEPIAVEDNAPEDFKEDKTETQQPEPPKTGPAENATNTVAELPELMDSYSSAPKPTPSQPLGEILEAQKAEKAEKESQEQITMPAKAPPTPQPVDPSSDTSTPIPAKEMFEDSKRKRRSVTPPPSAADVALKKARARDGTPVVTKKDSSALEDLQAIQAATEAAEAFRNPDGLGSGVPETETKDVPPTRNLADMKPSFSEKDATGNNQAALRSPTPEPAADDRRVSPAVHQATKSLYMRNFKRPLHIPTLRKHIEALAQPPSSAGSEELINNFHLDGIRTHALVSFKSVSAASRVRASMHDSVFPEEGTRIPIWVDFVPDDAVQKWIDKETSSSDRNRKWEVVYKKGADTMEAVHQEVGSFDTGRRPSVSAPRHISMSEALSRPQPAASGVHPDRAGIVPREERGGYDRGIPSRSEGRPGIVPKSDTGSGFKALDELFSSTTAKPKLYYKPVPAGLAAERLDMIKDLRVGHAEMGKSGDEGMKRYTLESHSGREEWVDKGPEFGYGRRGADTLAGFRGRGRGGFRGGGGGGGRGFDRDRGGGDSWRGRY